MTPEQRDAMGPNGCYCLGDYWYGKVFAVLCFLFIFGASALTLRLMWKVQEQNEQRNAPAMKGK